MQETMVCSNRSVRASHHHHIVRCAPYSVAQDRRPAIRDRIKSAFVSAAFLLAGFASLLGLSVEPAAARDLADRSANTQPSVSRPPAQAPQSAPAAAGLVVSTADVTVDKGDTLAKLLAAQGVPADNRRAVLAAISDIFDPASLQPGSRLRLTFAPPAADAAGAPAAAPARLVQTVELMSGDTTSITVHIDAPRQVSEQDIAHALRGHSAGQPPAAQVSAGKPAKASIWTANRQPAAGGAGDQQQASSLSPGLAPADDGQFIVRHVTGTVGKNLRTALLAEELPPSLVDEIMLGFKTGPGQRPALHGTASFDVIYEGVQRAGRLDEPQLRYAMLDDGGKTRRIYRYQTDDQTTTLMQDDGHGVALLDLGKPLQIDARITSPFGWRIHPVFGDRRFHEGVDFGAPTGTPVVAASDGVVEDIGWRGNYGKYIRLRHDGRLATAYAHLSGFARGLQRGSTVKRGDVIAYVGRSGVATGPHLYYEVLVDGKQIDPLKPTAVPVSLTGQQLAEFQRYVETTPEE